MINKISNQSSDDCVMQPTSKDTMSPVHRRHSCCCPSSLPNFSMDWVCLQQSGICKKWCSTWIVWIVCLN